uniref:Uncharacterized protein n=1 Tax=Tetraselmis sp. GSL018 TaxID=582737 RepID=A0A061SED9_9CHLO|mmetsp:Transcript_33702/g.79997  ORF Transcript_33702/g.79997 Transcript_33702/m.79997 type:complete len:88 (-) Transcript_33702:158-421(-)
MCCGPTGSMFCSLMSFFGLIFMSAIGFLISIQYPYVGEWHPEEIEFEKLGDVAKKSSGQCYAVAGVYGAFMVLSMVSYCYHSYRKGA